MALTQHVSVSRARLRTARECFVRILARNKRNVHTRMCRTATKNWPNQGPVTCCLRYVGSSKEIY